MSKITNDDLTRSGTGWFIAVPMPYGNSGHQRVKYTEVDNLIESFVDCGRLNDFNCAYVEKSRFMPGVTRTVIGHVPTGHYVCMAGTSSVTSRSV